MSLSAPLALWAGWGTFLINVKTRVTLIKGLSADRRASTLPALLIHQVLKIDNRTVENITL